MSEKKSGSYLPSYGILRIVTCFSVVFHHLISSNMNYINAMEHNWFIIALDNILMCNNDLFFMLSGKFVLEHYDGRIRKFYKDKFLKIVVPVLAISLLYYFKKNGFLLHDLSVTDFLRKFFANEILGYLWFVYVLIGFYLAVPILAPMLKSMKQKELRIFMFILLFFVLYDDICNLLYMNNVFMAFPFLDIASVLLGYLIDHVDVKKTAEYMIYAVGIPAALISCYIAAVLPNVRDICTIRFLMCSVIFLVITRHFTCDSDFLNTWIRRIGNQTYYVYLLHGLVQEYFFVYCWNIWLLLFKLPFTLTLFFGSVIIFIMAVSVSGFIRITERGCKRMWSGLQIPEILKKRD